MYVWDDRAQHGMNAAFAFSLLLILILLAGVYLIDRCNCWGRCLPQEIESSPDALDDEEDALVRAQKESSLPNELGGQGELLTCDITPLSINQGKLHRLRCKVKNPEPQSKHREGMQHSQSLLGHMERQLPAENRASTLLGRFKNVPFSVNLHKKFLVGVGLPLFHQSVMGILVMTVNWMIGLLHIFVSSKVGFARRDREGLLIFKAFSTLCFVSFLFNVAITIFPESSAHPLRFLLHPLGEGRPVTSMQDISFQVRASVHLFHVLVPGSLFIGYLLFPLQGFVWPAVSTISFLRFWHSRSFTPDLKAREAEKAMEPLGMSLGHDYMGFVVQPLSCSLTLFFASGVAWQTFAFLAAWSAFMMPFTRYMHLRAMRRSYFSTNRIDMDALFAWGFPHSQVLAASAFWAARIYNWTLLVVPATWLGALAVYHVLLAFIVQPLVLPKDSCESREVSYDEVRTRRFYDWHNCNPMKVLLSHCTSQKAIRPFEIGKEYLQENCPEWKERADKLRAEGGLLWTLPSDQVENEICPLMVPEVEDLLQRPVDWIGQASRSFATKSRLDVTSESPEAEPTLDPFQER